MLCLFFRLIVRVRLVSHDVSVHVVLPPLLLAPNQLFTLTSCGNIKWTGTDKCVDISGGVDSNGNTETHVTCRDLVSKSHSIRAHLLMLFDVMHMHMALVPVPSPFPSWC